MLVWAFQVEGKDGVSRTYMLSTIAPQVELMAGLALQLLRFLQDSSSFPLPRA